MKFSVFSFPTASLFLFLACCSCNNLIKNENSKVDVEEGTKVDASFVPEKKESLLKLCWRFEPDYLSDKNDSIKYSKEVYAGEAFYWNRENKISISIDEVNNGKVKGHSVVAGNERPFEGEYCTTESGFHFTCKEPGNDKHDGTFTFAIQDTLLKGKWKAFAKIDIQNRKYNLVKRDFEYKASYMLDSVYGSRRQFINWYKPEMTDKQVKTYNAQLSKEEKAQFEDGFYFNESFASTTENIYELNASLELLKEEAVANMSFGDLNIIRNTIYARHGYSFKFRPLRVFFDRQSWYVPYSANIKAEFTDIEKQNIQLLLKYEKNAKEFYDSFGRG